MRRRGVGRNVHSVQRSAALRLLSPTHAQILTLSERGLDREQIAAQLTLDPSAVEPVLQVARAKLAVLEQLDDNANDHRGR